MHYRIKHTPELKYNAFSDDKKRFFNELHQGIENASTLRVVIQDTPGYRIRLIQCAICHELYWFTDTYDDLDYCPICVPRIEELLNYNAYFAHS